jgi:murein DD-endopeptidase MepM/ murein hydrolase activator NlpD
MIALLWPIPNRYPVTQVFGANPKAYKKFGLKGHNGIDWGVPTGTPVVASHDGTVIKAEEDNSGYGVHVRLEGTECLTIYGHFSRVTVRKGQQVKAGEIIGYSGNTGNSTGPHLHFEVRIDGKAVDPSLHLVAIQPEQKPPAKAKTGKLVVKATDGLAVRTAPIKDPTTLIGFAALGTEFTKAVGEITNGYVPVIVWVHSDWLEQQ